MLIDFRERGRGGERERERDGERNIDMREKHRSVASRMCPDRGSNLQPRFVPWTGVEPAQDYIPTNRGTQLGICLTFGRATKQLSAGAAPLYIPTSSACTKLPNFSMSSPTFVIFWFCLLSHSNVCEGAAHGLGLHFPYDEWCRVSFHGLLDHFIPPLEKCLFKASAHLNLGCLESVGAEL